MTGGNGERGTAMPGPDPGQDATLASRGWAIFQIDASEPRDAERFIGAVDPAERKRVRDALNRALQEASSFFVEFHTVHPVGQQRLICARGKAERSGTARSVRLAGVLVDITDVGLASNDVRPHAPAANRLIQARLTHELNQPLMAILSNAEAGERFLQAPAPDIGELRSIFREICEDNQRAVAAMRRLRSLYLSENVLPETSDLKDRP